MRILLVEDEREMADLVILALGRHDILVDRVTTLELAKEACRSGIHDAVLLDRKLPDGDGLDLIPLLRKERVGVPVIVLSALGSAIQRIAGLDNGADDYLAKPFSVDELLARLRAVMRRPSQLGASLVNVARLSFDLAERQAYIDHEPLDLTRREVLALEILVRRAGRTVSRSSLEEAVYGYDDEIASNSLDSHISRLRHKLASAGVEIHGIRGLGYLLKAAP
ncbi:two-component system response regulator [Devosia sp. Root685]|uniref:response regulator transcription factor n=1 Tax=Devosia sp. Root685 TaxID=1736587 RepID=UPI0006F2295D|nr:response regulator transcription factor [Devosia sp. Root685]KRA98471.1 two-component system response regulator [Devosia sp. Root685]